MVDVSNSFDQQPVPPAEPEGGKPKSGSFFASTAGKIAIGGIVLVIVLLIVGTIAYVFLLSPGGAPSTSGTAGTVPTGQASIATSASASDQAAPITDPLEKPLESTFTFRNVFAPTVKQELPQAATTASSTTSTSSSSTVSVPKNTLYLQSIQTVNGRKTGTFIWNGKTYVLAEGDSIEGTPWKVVEIGSTSVVMLYGDTEITLTTGQGLSK